jgi:2,4-dienoyl-CoA reductase-like NADH-dependent reductase (Old Yellow Enzyme family)
MNSLFTPAKIGSLILSNRILRSATAERMADDNNGYPLPSMKALWVALAKGGCGLIISGHMYIHPSGKCHPEMSGIFSDAHIAPWQALTDAVHQAGGRVAAQINHSGLQCEVGCVADPIAPSAIEADFINQPIRAMTENEIELLIDAYAQAARRAKSAGFDAIQIHGAHGYLISQFLSPFANRRTDAWGGDTLERTHFLREVVRAIRQQIGRDYPVFIKLGMQDGLEDGLTAAEGAQIVAMLAGMGLDAVEISGGLRASNSKRGISKPEREAYFRQLAKLARANTSLPLALVGGLRSRSIMDELLDSNEVDFISLCRPLINAPDFPNQLKSGAVRKSACISANNCWALGPGIGIGCKCQIG